MKVEWFNHTGIVVQDMEKMLAFYKDVLELEEERNRVLEGPLADQLVGYKDAKLHVIYLGNGDMRHSVELVSYINPPPGETMRRRSPFSAISMPEPASVSSSARSVSGSAPSSVTSPPAMDAAIA